MKVLFPLNYIHVCKESYIYSCAIGISMVAVGISNGYFTAVLTSSVETQYVTSASIHLLAVFLSSPSLSFELPVYS